jgi:hypothetical protein
MIKTILSLAIVATAAACGSDGTTSPPQITGPSIDVATVVAQMSTGGLSAIATPAASELGNVSIPTIPASAVAACPYSTTTQMFVCPQYSANGIAYSVSYSLTDAGGHGITAATSTGIASIRVILDFAGTYTPSGTVIGPSFGTQQGHSDMTSSGLLTNGRTYNGTTSQHIDLLTNGVQSSSDATIVTSNLVIPVSQSSTQAVWPTGVVTTDAKIALDLGANTVSNLESGFILTFDGTSRVKITTTTNGQAMTSCTVAMTATGLGPCPS